RDWWTVTALRKPKEQGGVGAAPEAVKQALQSDRFESTSGEAIGKRKDAIYYRLGEPSRGSGDGRDASTQRQEEDEASRVTSYKGGDARDASSCRDFAGADEVAADEVERLAERFADFELEPPAIDEPDDI